MRKQTDQEFFEARVFRPETPCWNWRSYINRKGYGTWRRDGINTYVHRIAYELLVGTIPEGMEVHHKCWNRSCVNPEHLELVSHAANIAANGLKTHCVNGHEFTPENTRRNKRGRQCRTCLREHAKKSSERRRRKKGMHDLSKTCKNGHPRTPENTYVYPKSGYRTCKLCLQAKYLKPGGYKDPARERPSHCPKGHPYDEENTYVTPNGKYFYCRECNRQAARRKAA